jgi:hypothetical protein
MDTEQHNAEQVRRLNQRGGRTMSIVDLCQAHTITPAMAALCWMQIESGASLLTGAVPGGAGKTTLMAALLGFLPRDERIVTVSDRSVLDRALRGDVPCPAALLAHEIGSGSWFGYIWGRDAADFFRCIRGGTRAVSCLHTDNPDQTRQALLPLGVREQDLRKVGLQLYIQRDLRHGRHVHRVTGLYCRLGQDMQRITRWSKQADRHELLLPPEDICAALAENAPDPSAGELRQAWAERQSRLEQMIASDTTAWRAVRDTVLECPA